MNKQQINNILSEMHYQNGSYIKIAYDKDMTTVQGKKHGHSVTKMTDMTVRLGINYGNTNFAKNRMKNEANAPVREQWYKHTDNKYIVEHKTNGKEYLQVFASPNKAKSKYDIDGIQITKNEYEDYIQMGIAKKPSQNNGEICVMTIPIENIKKIGHYIIR